MWLYNGLQTAMARQSASRAGVRNKTKDQASLERSERRGFCFVGKDLLVRQLSRILPVVPENNQLKFLFSWPYPVVQCILFSD